MRCSKCGCTNEETSRFCCNCGAVLYQEDVAPTVPDRLTESVFVTIFCCIPFGIVGIIKSCDAKAKLNAGDYEGAITASNEASSWNKWGVGITLAVVLLRVLLMIAK